ncbi:MAG: hypothetical protein CMP48_03005 [Rickettsiales bacterium]|nr:hypothetical protein [Rickettsiales bacterium]
MRFPLVIAFIFVCSSLIVSAENTSVIEQQLPVCGATVDLGSTDYYFTNLLETRYWPARWTCGQWSDWEGWFYILSDVLIFLSYFSIPIFLLWYIRKKELGKMKWIVGLFIVFIAFCGISHLIDAILFWEPVYRLSGLIKGITAFVSLSTAVVLGITFPEILKYKSSEELSRDEKERERLKELFEMFLKLSPGAVAMVDRHLNYIMINKNWSDQYKVGNERNQSLYSTFDDLSDDSIWMTRYEKVLSGHSIHQDSDSITFNEEEIYLNWKLHPWKDADGEIGGFIAFHDIISKQVKLQDELEQLDEQIHQQTRILSDLSETAKIGTWQLNLKDNSLEWSEVVYDIHELPRGTEIKLDEAVHFYHTDFEPIIHSAIDKALSEGKGWDLELKLVTAKNKEIWVRAIGKVVKEHGQVVALHGLFQDIDTKKKAELVLETSHKNLEYKVEERTRDLEVANKELEAFTYSVSHDLRAPLRAINGFAEALEEDCMDQVTEDGHHYLRRIIKNSLKMGDLIDDLLEFSRINKRKESIKLIDMDQLVREVINDCFVGAPIKIGELPNCYGDKAMIRQVIQNLLSNAIKYSSTEPNPSIEITGQQFDDEVCYNVVDNGVGFDMKYSEKLFGIFQRLHRDDEFEGTGVGLALCYKIISRHKGKITARSEVGKGSTFSFTLKSN